MEKKYIGIVSSDKMDKTIVAVVSDVYKHPLYKKYIKRKKKFKIHDENNQAKTGDKIEFVETRPLSKEKRWNLKRVISK